LSNGDFYATAAEFFPREQAFHPHNERAIELAAKLQPEDFTILEEKQKQRVISVKRASEAPPLIAVLIQDDLVSRVSNERIFSKDV
jgi:hypothetical protein